MRVGDRVKTPLGPGTVRLVVCKPPKFRELHSVSVVLDDRDEVKVFAADKVTTPDVLVTCDQSFWYFEPQNEPARLWFEEHCPGAAWHGPDLVCDPRFGPDLTRAMRGAGFMLERP